MSPACHFSVGVKVLLAALLCGAFSLAFAAAEPPSSQKTTIVGPKTTLPPAVEAKLKDFLAKVKVEKVKVWNARMQREIENIAKSTGLGDDGSKALAAPANQAVETSLAEWDVKMNNAVHKQFLQMPPEQLNMVLDQTLTQAAAFAQADWIADCTLPFDQESWLKALHQTLTPGQSAAWDKAQIDRKQAIEKEIGDTLKTGADRIRDAQTQEIVTQCHAIEATVGLPPDRTAQLETLCKSIADQTTEMWRKRVEKMLLAMDDDQRHQFTNGGNIFIGTNEDEAPEQQASWKEGLAKLLTAGETTRLQTAQNDRKSKRALAMGRIMLMLLDEKIAFTEAQRQRLQPITDRLVKDVPELYPDDTGNMYGGVSSQIFFSAATHATDAELKSILDDIQLNRWRHLSDDGDEQPGTPDAGESKPEAISEPEDVEKAISSFLYDRTEKERTGILKANTLKAEDASRVAGLNEASASRLQAAARGTTEEYLSNWKWITEQQVRSQLQDVTPQNVRQRLDSIQDYMFQQNIGQINQQTVWDETVKTDLTREQQDSWHKEIDARTAYHDQAITSLIMVEFDRRNPITHEQWEKLEPLISGIIHDYGPDFSQVFAFANGTSWYMQGVYLLMPFSGLSDTDLKTILTKDQLDKWHGSPECANTAGLWQNIQQIHNQRQRTR